VSRELVDGGEFESRRSASMLKAIMSPLRTRALACLAILAFVALCLPDVSAGRLPPPEQYYPDRGIPDIGPEHIAGPHGVAELGSSIPETEDGSITEPPPRGPSTMIEGKTVREAATPTGPSGSAILRRMILWLRCYRLY
jgi:hypothetical protein